MALHMFGRNHVPRIAAGLGTLLLLLLACGTQQPAGVPTAPPSLPNPSQEGPEATVQPVPALTPPPLIAPASPSGAPGSPAISPAGSPEHALQSTTATSAPIPQTAALKLEVTSPGDNAVVNSQLITVAGLTSPDAAVSVNGRLVTPDPDGRFATDLLMPLAYNPLPIEVIATSISGEQRWVVLAVVYIP